MQTDLLAAFCLFALVITVTPGPNNMMVLASGVRVGVRRTMPLVLGIAVGVGLMTLGIGFGLGAEFEAFSRFAPAPAPVAPAPVAPAHGPIRLRRARALRHPGRRHAAAAPHPVDGPSAPGTVWPEGPGTAGGFGCGGRRRPGTGGVDPDPDRPAGHRRRARLTRRVPRHGEASLGYR